MGVLTTTYHVPASITDQVISKPELLEQLFYPEYRNEGDATPEDVGLSADWTPEDYGFDKGWEDYVGLLNKTKRWDLTRALEREVTEVEHEGGAWIRYWSVDQMRRLSELMSDFTSDELYVECQAFDDLTNYDDYPYDDFTLKLDCNTHDSFAKFVHKIAQAGHTMFASTS